MKPEEVLSGEELKEAKKKARRKSIVITRWLCAVIVLGFLSLSWYGAEMLLYGYSQPSVVKAIVAVCIALSLSGRIQKEMIWNDSKKDIIENLKKSIKRDGGDCGRDCGRSSGG